MAIRTTTFNPGLSDERVVEFDDCNDDNCHCGADIRHLPGPDCDACWAEQMRLEAAWLAEDAEPRR